MTYSTNKTLAKIPESCFTSGSKYVPSYLKLGSWQCSDILLQYTLMLFLLFCFQKFRKKENLFLFLQVYSGVDILRFFLAIYDAP